MNNNAKTFAQDVEAAIAAAAGSVKYKNQFDSFESALEATKERTKFDPSLSQFVLGTVLDFDPAKMKIGISDIGNNGATVLSVPAGTKGDNGKVNFNRAMNVYLSSLGKTIRCTDAAGEPVQNADGSQKTVTGKNNPVWEAIDACKSDSEILSWLKGKTLEVVEIKREYGPANFVEIGGTRTPKGHRLTSLPLFREL
jgi:hypothetical protein